MPPKAAQAILREQYAAEPPAGAGIEEGLRTRDTLRLKQPPTADQMPPRARNIAAERQGDVLKGPQPGQLEATPEELGQMFGIEGDLSSGQVPPIPPEKVAVPGRGPLGGGSTSYRMFDISNRETRANVSQAIKPDLKTRFFATLRRLLGNVGSGSPSQWAAEKIKREALGPVGREISGMKASLTDDMWRISESLDRDKSGRVDPQMLQFRRMMKEVEGGTIAKLPAEWQPLARTLRSIYDQIGQIIKRTPGLDRTELIANYVSHYWKATPRNSQILQSKFSGAGFGGGSFGKRTHATYEDGIKAGLEPASTSPTENIVRYLDAMGQTIAEARMAENLKNSPYSVWGRPVNVGASGQEVMHVYNPVPEGYEPLNIAGATRQRGPVREQMYVPRDMAYALNQFKDLGLKRYGMQRPNNIYIRRAWSRPGPFLARGYHDR